MLKNTSEALDRLSDMLGYPLLTDGEKDMLGQSLFYYCSGKDPTPIIALGAKIPLYVYVDSLHFDDDAFSSATAELYARLKKHGFLLCEKRNLEPNGRLSECSNADATLWKNASGESFLLLYVQGDAALTYGSIYADEENYIQPKYICNYRYELRDRGLLSQVEKRVEYILGHCHDPKYRCIDEYAYYGDYGEKDVGVKLYRRLYYYLF